MTKNITKEQAIEHLSRTATNGLHIKTINDTKKIKRIIYNYLDHEITYFFYDEELTKIETYNGYHLNEFYVK